MVVKGKSRNPQMRVGVFAKLRSIYDLPMETFRVIEIKHYQEGYEYYNEFTAIPDAFIPYYYDEDSYPKALQQPARVIDNNDPEGLGRVQVQFVWQERKKEHTPWIRAVQPHAGAGKGFYFIPEIGEEVWVDFEDQNAERPFVVGSNYNGKEFSKYHTAGNDKKVIHTRSGTKIILNDGEGSVFIEDPSGNTYLMDGQGNINVSAPKDITFKAGGDINLNANKNIFSTASLNIVSNAGVNMVDIAGKDISQFASGDIREDSNVRSEISKNERSIQAKKSDSHSDKITVVSTKQNMILQSEKSVKSNSGEQGSSH